MCKVCSIVSVLANLKQAVVEDAYGNKYHLTGDTQHVEWSQLNMHNVIECTLWGIKDRTVISITQLTY